MYRNYFFSLLLNIFKIAAPIFVIPYVYREISPYDMGVVNLTITVMTYFYIFGDLGVYIYGFREVSLHKDDKAYINKLFTELFVFRLIFNTIVTCLYFLYVYKFSETVIPFHFYLIASIQLLSTFFSVEWMFEGNSKFKFVSIKTIIIRTIFLLLTFILVRGESASEFYLFTLTGFLLANNLVSFVYLQRFVVWDFKNLNLIKHWPSLFMIFIMINWSMLYFQTDKNILGIKGNIIGVGYYSMCEKILLLSSSVVFSLITISTPKLGTSLMVGIGNYKSMLTRVFHVFFIISFSISSYVYVSSREIVLLLGGENYQGAITTMRLFSFFIVLYLFMEIVKTNVFLLLKKENIFFFVVLFIGGSGVITKLVFLPTLVTVNDIVMLTLLLVSIVLIILFCYMYYKLQIKIFQIQFIYIFLSAIVFIVASSFINIDNLLFSLIIKLLLLLFVLFVVLFLFKDKILFGLISKIYKLKNN